MKVAAKANRSVIAAIRGSARSTAVVSILLITRNARRRSRASCRSAISPFASRPFFTSSTSSTRSASAMPAEAAFTIAVSSRRLGAAKIPGVSTNSTWVLSTMVIPITRRRVVWTLGETIETLVPTSWLSRVDLPTFGAPMMATKPARVGAGSAISGLAHSGQHQGGSGVFGRALGAGGCLLRRLSREAYLDGERHRVGRSLRGDDAVGRRLQALRMRELLQACLRIPRRRLHDLDHRAPVGKYEFARGGEAAV